MRGNNVLGIIFSNMKDQLIRELTDQRTMGSVPFGGRYRLIDFPLSNMTNSGIGRGGVITKSHYRSLMDHVGSGKAWDLSRKRSGLVFLPPYRTGNALYINRMGALEGIREFIASSKEEYVFMTDCDIVCSLDVQKIVDFHLENSADITIVYTNGDAPERRPELITMDMDSIGHVTDIRINPNSAENVCFGLGMYVMRRDFLVQMIDEASCHNLQNFEMDILQSGVAKYRIFGYEHKGFVGIINSLSDYHRVNMQLLQEDVRKALFSQERPVYTKVRDEMPARYGLGSQARNSLIADGCIIDGEVENCILFRGVRVGKGARLVNSIVMQGSIISGGCDLNYLIVDKNVTIRPERRLMGYDSYPVYIGKGSIV